MRTFTLRVVDIVKKTPDVITIFLKQPGLKKVKYKAGQYLTVVIRIKGRKYIRPYSFSSAPEIDEHMAITVKRMPNGIVSNYLYDHTKIDDMMEVMEPMGNFVYDPQSDVAADIMLWAAGSGITPLMAILKTALSKTADAKVTLFYCNRNPEHVIFFDELNQLRHQYAGRFAIHNFYTQIPEDIYLEYVIRGRIDGIKITSILSGHANLSNSVHYICGPEGLKFNVKSALKSFNILAENIYTEDFEVVLDAQQFDDIETREIKITDNGLDYNIEVIKGVSLLNAALDAGLDLSYSCQTGTCLLCKAKLLNGKVKLIGIDHLPDGLAPNDCLLCCSYPYSKNIEILTNK